MSDWKQLDATHDTGLQSWVASANHSQSDFPIQNLPFGRFVRKSDKAENSAKARIGVAIGEQILDLRLAAQACAWPEDVAPYLRLLAEGDLNAFMALGHAQARAVRRALSLALSQHASAKQQQALAECLVRAADVDMLLPCKINDYTDFYTGIHHATRVGKLFRPDNPLLPNYQWVPIGYHGRSSSIVPSGAPIRRPVGQTKGEADTPLVVPSKRLDYELELAYFVGQSNALGEPIAMANAEAHLFGLALFNDWSARDIQAWEYQPLGPFLSKNFASSVSPWVVTMQALAPFRSPFDRSAFTQIGASAEPLPYLDSAFNREAGLIDITLEVYLHTPQMKQRGDAPERISRGNLLEAAFWTPAQLIAHHSVNGCNLQAGDLLGSGTLSGPRPEQAGSLLELSLGGKQPLTLANGEKRSFLEDGDTVIFTAYCEREGQRRIGLGRCEGTVIPAENPAEVGF